MATNVPYEWVREFVELDRAAEEVADKLTAIGLAVDEITEDEKGDAIFCLDITANRADCFGIYGVARELAAAFRLPLTKPDVSFDEAAKKASDFCTVVVEDPKLCARYIARIITGLKIAPSPEWMARRLRAVGLRPINNVVDITNYVLFELNQPLHAFDTAKLSGRTISVRAAKEGERLALLDGGEAKLKAGEIVIANSSAAIALAGIMGGASSEVGDGTEAILLESASFNQVAVRRASRRLGVSTDSSFRFERGVDVAGIDFASRRACRLFAELAGGSVAAGSVDTAPDPPRMPEIVLRFDRIGKLLGIEVAEEEARGILSRLGFHLEPGEEGGSAKVSVPPWREDVTGEADLVEEVARIKGYDAIPSTPKMRVSMPVPHPEFTMRAQVREALIACGCTEVVSETIWPRSHAEACTLWKYDRLARVDNPVRKGTDILRTSLMPGLIAAVRTNERARVPTGTIFETGPVYLVRETQYQPVELHAVALLDDSDFLRAKGAAEALCRSLGIVEPLVLKPESNEAFTEETSSSVCIGGRKAGFAGEVSRKVLDVFEVRGGCSLIELDLAVLAHAARRKTFHPLPLYPEIARDVAIAIDETIPWERIVQAVEEVDAGGLVRSAPELIDVYRGKQAGKGKKSVAFRVTYRAEDRTLTDEEVAPVHEALREHVSESLNATLR